MKTPKQLSLEDAQKIAEESDYAFAASGTDCNPINWGDAAAFVLEGYKACFAELTRWNDPKEKLPDNKRDVLVKTTLCREYRIAWYKADGARNYHWHENNGALDDDMVIGWREIY